jgi:tetratricopeptide (TPR) repeat protein
MFIGQMKKKNQISALAGMVIGIIFGVIIANQPSPRAQKIAPSNDSSKQNQIAEQQRLLNNDPENQQSIVAMANSNYDAKNYDEATRWYEKALLKDPNNANLLTDLGTSYLQLKQFNKAFECYRRSLAIDPMDRQTLTNLGVARLASGDEEGAADAWEKVLALYPTDPNAETLRTAIHDIRTKRG